MIGSEVGVGVGVGVGVAVAVGVGVDVDAAGASLMRGKMQPDKQTTRSEAIAISAAVRIGRRRRIAGASWLVDEGVGTDRLLVVAERSQHD